MKSPGKISTAAALSFLLAFSVCLCLIIAVMRPVSNNEKHKMDEMLVEKSTRINETILRLLYKVQVLSALVIQSDGQIDNFERVASIIFDDPVIFTFAIAPNGVISDVYPWEENKNAIGLNLLDPSITGNKEAIMAKESGQFIFGGPFEYVQGGQGFSGRMPVYLDTPEGGEEFWGLVSISLKYPEALEDAGLDSLEKQGYAYELWRINPDDNQKQIIAEGGSAHGKNTRFVEKQISIQNANWYLRIMPVREWYEYPGTWLLVCLGALISCLISLAVNRTNKLSSANREVRERLESIIQTAPIAYMLTLKDEIAEINDVMKDYTGLAEGDGARSFYAEPEARDDMIERVSRQGMIRNEIIRFNTKSGESHRGLLSGAIVEYGQERAFAVWMVDIEYNEIKSDQLKSARQDLQTMLDLLPVPVRVVGVEDKTISYVNKSCAELFECSSREQMLGRPLSEMMPEIQSDGMPSSEKIRLMMAGVEPCSMEIEYKSMNGRHIDSFLTSFKLDYNGKFSSVGVIMDLERQRSEAKLRSAALAAEASSRAKSAFIANMSHEIRTPMNSIIGFSELALDGDVPAETRDYLEKIKISSDLLLRIIDDILDMSKIESGKIELEQIPFNMHDVFRVCQTIIAPKAEDKGITLYCYAEPSLGKKLLGDPTRLRQVLLNLLTNAVKFTNSGMVKLLAAIENDDGDSVTMRFEVKDSGIGMTPEQLEKVFEPFVQADESTTRRYGGTGLGLPISRGMIELMGGELSAESAPGVGTRFGFSLTFPTVDRPGVSGRFPGVSPLNKPVFNGEVLLCEDNEMNRQVICEHLSRVGLRTVVADNGRDGVEIALRRMESGEKPFDLIFMDIHMPVMDGLEAAEAIVKAGNQTPMIALTANVMNDDREAYRAHGMLDHVPKPFKAHELWACLLKYLTPVTLEAVDPAKQDEADKSQRKRLMRSFVKDHRTAPGDIARAVEAGDIELAHRLAHTLKGVAGLIGKSELANAAHAVERLLEETGVEYDREQLGEMTDNLGRELDKVLAELEPLLDEETSRAEPTGDFDEAEAFALFEKLEPLLRSLDTDCLSLTDDLRPIPGAGPLIEQIEQYNFEAALETFADIRQDLGV